VNELIAALCGAVIGGVLAWASAWTLAERHQRRRLRALKSALAAEIATCIEIARVNNYEEQFLEMADRLRAHPGAPEMTSMHVPAHHNYFSVFEANAGDIGELDTPLAVRIVCFYQAARAWLDSTSRENIPGSGTSNPGEEAFRHEALALQIRRLCELGDELVVELASSKALKEIKSVSKVLTLGDYPPVLPQAKSR
jgi:hypothetical protein